MEVCRFNSMTRAEVHGLYIVKFIQENIVLVGFLGMTLAQVLQRFFCISFWVGLWEWYAVSVVRGLNRNFLRRQMRLICRVV